MRVGVISDTHGLLRPEAEALLVGVEHILHAGDIGAPDIVPRLQRIAPVTAIRGNVDIADWACVFPGEIEIRLAGRRILMLHDLTALETDPAAAGIDIVISGHSHQPEVREVGGVLHLNPGSAGRRRFTLPATLAIMDLSGDRPRAVIHDLFA